MTAISLGPLALPLGAVLLLASFALAAAAGWLAARRQAKAPIVTSLLDMLIAGVLAARAGFVLRWLEAYRDAPWTALDIRDGGFEPWAGIAGVALVGAWQGWRKPALRRPIVAGVAAGLVAWTGGWGALRLLETPDGRTLPSAELATLEGSPATIPSLAQGKPMVLNLWATWCPPCRREMPVLAQAQRRSAGAVFVFANQGEGPEVIRRYLQEEGLALDNVLLDPQTRLARETGSPGLPTTLFYDAQGRLVDAHMGALSAASLAAKLSALRVAPGR
jgi:thiol-disulfide isomerase/thioredoxin